MRFFRLYFAVISWLWLPFLYKNWHLRILGELGFDKSRFRYVLWNGLKLKGVYEINIIYDIWKRRVYNPKGLEISDFDIVIDIGAHKGIFSTFAALQGEGVKIFSYEPVERNYKLLRDNISLNGLSDKIKAFNFAVASENKVEKLFVRDGRKDSATHSFYHRAKGDKEVEVKCLRLEDIFEQNGIGKCDFLKLDCQGAEYQILLKASHNLLNRVGKIAMEYHVVEGFRVENLAGRLQSLGFEVWFNPPYLYAIAQQQRE